MELKQTVNLKYAPILKNPPHYVILMGGRGAGRSTFASQLAMALLTAANYFRCAIMRLVLGDIRNSIYREIIDRADETGIKSALDINDGPMVIRYGANTINAVGFKKSSGEQKAKLKSLANYNYVIVEEADEIAEADFIQLDDSLRTLKGDIVVILLLNPPNKDHWIIKRWFDLEPVEGLKDFYMPVLKPEITNTLFIHTTWEDNRENIAKEAAERYESYKTTKPAHYWNMVRGLVPETVKGKIYSGWQQIDEIPFEARLERIGLDFGYTNDPTALVAVYYYNGGYILDEIVYKQELSNKEIADIINLQPHAMVIADSAEPKSIEEIRRNKIVIMPASKGPGSINQGIQYVQAQKISVTRRSENIWNEYNNYAWLVDKEDNTLNEPKDAYNHSMDAIRYAIASIKDPNQSGASVHYPSNTMPRNNLPGGNIQMTPGGPVNLNPERPKVATTYIPRL